MRLRTLWEGRWIFAVWFLFAVGFWEARAWLTAFPSFVTLGLLCYTLYFFRDPDRSVPGDSCAVVAAADGVVMDIKEVDEAEVTQTKMKRVGIFLSVLDVHTNRAPIGGEVIYSVEHTGICLDARDPDASGKNASRTWGFRNGTTTVVVRQLTGWIARRIVGWAKVGDRVEKGDRFGMIRFGSRTEVYIPLTAKITVAIGDRVKGGETIIARLQ
jgi:phosphatidylserine decarboxylase